MGTNNKRLVETFKGKTILTNTFIERNNLYFQLKYKC